MAAYVESGIRGPGPVDGGRPRPARGDCGRVRDHGGREGREVADLRHRRHEGLLAELPAAVYERRPGRRRREVPAAQAGAGRGDDPGQRRQPGARRSSRVARSHRGKKLDFVWSGITSTRRARARRRLHAGRQARSHRTFELPSPIRLDTKPPVVTVHHQLPVFSPDGDGHNDTVRVPYRVNEPARGILLVDKQRVLLTYRKPLTGSLLWDGKLGTAEARQSGPLRPLDLGAGRGGQPVTKPFPFAIVQVRYITLARNRVVVRPGAKFALRVSADTPSVGWTLHGRSGGHAAHRHAALHRAQVGRRLPPLRGPTGDARRALHGGGRMRGGHVGAAQAAVFFFFFFFFF